MAKLTEKKTETQLATDALVSNFESLNVIAEHENEKKAPAEEAANKKVKKDTLVTFNVPNEDFDKYKKWFGSKGVTMSQGLRMCLDYLYYQDQSERVVLTKSGIRENSLMRLQ